MDVSNEKYESFDPHYTVEISRRMRVPDRLSIGPNPINSNSSSGQAMNNSASASVTSTEATKKILHDMAVPEKIVVGGFNQHLALKPEPRPLADILTVATSSASGAAGLALGDPQQANFVALPTPPRTLTVDTYLERTAQAQQTDDEDGTVGRQYSKSLSEAETPTGEGRLRRTESQLSTAALSGCEDDDTKLRRQMVRLARRVDWLEDENRRRSNRDLFYGTLVFGYVVFKVVTWLIKLPR